MRQPHEVTAAAPAAPWRRVERVAAGERGRERAANAAAQGAEHARVRGVGEIGGGVELHRHTVSFWIQSRHRISYRKSGYSIIRTSGWTVAQSANGVNER